MPHCILCFKNKVIFYKKKDIFYLKPKYFLYKKFIFFLEQKLLCLLQTCIVLKIICGVIITSCSGQDPHATDDSILSSHHHGNTPVHKSATLDPIRRRGNHGNISSSNPNLAGSNDRDAEDDQGSL